MCSHSVFIPSMSAVAEEDNEEWGREVSVG